MTHPADRRQSRDAGNTQTGNGHQVLVPVHAAISDPPPGKEEENAPRVLVHYGVGITLNGVQVTGVRTRRQKSRSTQKQPPTPITSNPLPSQGDLRKAVRQLKARYEAQSQIHTLFPPVEIQEQEPPNHSIRNAPSHIQSSVGTMCTRMHGSWDTMILT